MLENMETWQKVLVFAGIFVGISVAFTFLLPIMQGWMVSLPGWGQLLIKLFTYLGLLVFLGTRLNSPKKIITILALLLLVDIILPPYYGYVDGTTEAAPSPAEPEILFMNLVKGMGFIPQEYIGYVAISGLVALLVMIIALTSKSLRDIRGSV